MNLAAIVLAAGAGRRFGGNKLLALFKGEPLIRHALRAALAAPVSRTILVTKSHWDAGIMPEIETEIETLRIDSLSLSASLQAGIASLGNVDGAFIFLGDMPLIPHGIAQDLLANMGNASAAIPRYKGQHGHPVLLSARIFPAIAQLTGDAGAGRLLKSRSDVSYLDCIEEGVLLDIDRAEDIALLEGRS